MDKKNNFASEDYGKRIIQTKREIAELSEELERLIHPNVGGKSKSEPTNVKENIDIIAEPNVAVDVNEEPIKEHIAKSPAARSHLAKTSVSRSLVKLNEDKNETETLCRKAKTYDKEAAKEYIKHQREKWKEERQKLTTKTKIDQEIKKQKLNELQQKSLALVQRNLQSKKGRNWSREKRDEIRLDRNRSSPIKRDVSKARVQLRYDEKFRTKTEPFLLSKSPRSVQKKTCSDSQLNEIIVKKNKTTLLRNAGRDEIKKDVPENNSSENFMSNDLDEAATKIQVCYRGYLSRKNEQNDKIEAINNKKTQETQTSIENKKSTPVWPLSVPNIDPYPCNFINTVRRKLQNVINSPVNYRDIGIQSSIAGSSVKNENKIKKDETTPHNSNSEEKSEFKSFVSHQRNLDASALRHLALVHNNVRNADKVKKIDDEDNSESDTSKNIPEISTESGSISNNDKVVRPISTKDFLVICTDRIKNMRLKNSKSEKENNKFLEVPGPFDVEKSFSRKSYTFNFYEDENSSAKSDTKNKSRSADENVNKSEKYNIDVKDKNIPKLEQQQHSKQAKAPIEYLTNRLTLEDSILSFNKSEYNVYKSSNIPNIDKTEKSVPKNSTSNGKSWDSLKQSDNGNPLNYPVASDSNDEIKTEKSSVTSLSSSLRSISSKKSNKSNKITLGRGDGNGTYYSRKSVTNIDQYENGESNEKELIKNIEKSLDTSLISHISERGSNSSHRSTSPSIKSIKTNEKTTNSDILSSEENDIDEVSEMDAKLSSSSKSLSKSVRNISNERKISKKSPISSVISSLKNNINREEKSESRSFSKMSVDETRNSNDSSMTTKQISTEKSNEKMVKSAEFVSLYSSNFSSEDKSASDNSEIKNSKAGSLNSSNDEDPKETVKESFVMNFDEKDEEIMVESQPKVKNITGRLVPSKTERNEIHLKFEAEVHLLNDFNESLKQFMAVEKAFESIKNKSENVSGNSSNIELCNDSKLSGGNLSRSILSSSINMSRGTDLSDYQFSRENFEALQTKENATDMEISRKTIENYSDSDEFRDGSSSSNLAGLSIRMFDQLIRDEDVRIENLKTIIKIREQALLDRTKGELAWLEIQRKQLKETGKLHEASLVKKKQRGILLKHQQERREMQRLKQLQTKQSNERKTILKEQRNLIKAKLTSERMMSEMKIHNTPRKRRTSGPMRVLKSSESIHSETSISRKNSDGEEIFSVMSRKSSTIRLSEIETSAEVTTVGMKKIVGESRSLTDMNKVLFMRQTDLMKRRRAVEDLLQRHQKLLEEERKIEELEMAANAVIMQMSTSTTHNQPPKSATEDATSLRLKGRQLNELIHKIGSTKKTKRYVDNKTYILPKSSYDKLTARLRTLASANDEAEAGKKEILSIDAAGNEGNADGKSRERSNGFYSDDFESDTRDIEVERESEERNLSSLSELIQDFSQIEQGIALLSNGKRYDDAVAMETAESNSVNSEESPKDSSVIETHVDQADVTKSEAEENGKVSRSIEDEVSSMIGDAMALSSSSIKSIILDSRRSIQSEDDFLDEAASPEVQTSKNEDVVLKLQQQKEEERKDEVSSASIPLESIIDPEKTTIDSENGTDISKNITAENEKEIDGVSTILESLADEDVSSMILAMVPSSSSIIIEESIDLKMGQMKTGEASTESGGVSSERLSQLGKEAEELESFLEEKDEEIVVESGEKLLTKFNDGDNAVETYNSKIPETLFVDEENDRVEAAGERMDPKLVASEENDEFLETEKKDLGSSSINSDFPTEENSTGEVRYSVSSQAASRSHSSKISTEEETETEDKEQASARIESSENGSLSDEIRPPVESLNEGTDKDVLSDEINRGSSQNDTPQRFPEDLEQEIGEIKDQDSSTNISLNKTYNIGAFSMIISNGDVMPTKNFPGVEEGLILEGNSKEDVSESIPLEAQESKIVLENLVEDENEEIDTSSKSEAEISCSLKRNDAETISYSSSDSEIVPVSSTAAKVEEEEEEEDEDEGPSIEYGGVAELFDGVSASPRLVEQEDTPTDYTDDFEEEENGGEDDDDDSAFKEENSSGSNKDSNGGDGVSSSSSSSLENSSSKNSDGGSDSLMLKGDAMKGRAEISTLVGENEQIAVMGGEILSKGSEEKNEDLSVTYEDVTPVTSPETTPQSKIPHSTSINLFGNEAEELLKKQLAIEQEIKHLEQQQKEQMPFVYMREIPNKPPPPYTPPTVATNPALTILPATVEDVTEICNYSAKVLYNAYLSNNLDTVTFSESEFKSINKTKSTRECCLFVFDLCREVAKRHYGRFEKQNNDRVPVWLKIPDSYRVLRLGKPFDYAQLEKHINAKVKEVLGFERPKGRENCSSMKWGRKKKDHVDEILVLESKAEEHEWLNYDKDELMVKNEVTNEIFNELLNETVEIFRRIFP